MRALFALVLVAGCASDPRLPGDGAPADAHGTPVFDVPGAVPGDLVTTGALILEAPPRGRRLWSEIIFQDGATESIEIATDDDGRVVLRDVDAHASTVAAASTAPGPCADTAGTTLAHRWDQRFDWWFNAGSDPKETAVNATEAALKAATTNITRGDNSCGMADQIDATHAYLGRTTSGVQISASGGCGGGDGKNVVGFGDLPAGVLGVACTWSTLDGVAVESDVRLNKVDYDWVNNIGDGCQNRFHVESVMTHERGHTFGLGHVGETAHGKLTMSTAINGPCQKSEATLGRGDVLALRALY